MYRHIKQHDFIYIDDQQSNCGDRKIGSTVPHQN